MRTTITLIALLGFASCTRNCEKKGKHNKVTYVNNSDRNIQYKVIDNYPYEEIPIAYGSGWYGRELAPHASYVETMDSKYKCVESRFTNGKTYWVYFYDTDSLSKYSYGYSTSNPSVLLERKAVDLNYLQQHDFVLTYSD
jgi:hypothetical protein